MVICARFKLAEESQWVNFFSKHLKIRVVITELSLPELLFWGLYVFNG